MKTETRKYIEFSRSSKQWKGWENKNERENKSENKCVCVIHSIFNAYIGYIVKD